MKRILPLLLAPAILAALIAAQQSESDAAKAQKEKKAKQDAAQAKKDTAPAKRGGALPQNVEPPQPVLAWIYPAGGQRGHTVEVTASGTGIRPDQVLVTGTGITTRVLQSKDPSQARIAVTIAPDAETGIRELRILNSGGVSNRFRFVVGDLPEINEIEPNSSKAAPQRVESLPVVINGQITEGDRDYFHFHAAAGQTVICEVQARALLPYIADAVPGWFDPVLAIYDSSGHQLDFADDFRVNPDPILAFHAPRDGDYTLELRDVIYRGRGDFVYRLTLGGNSPDTTVRFPKITLPLVNAAAPNDTPAQAQRVTPPIVIEGRIQRPGASGYYQFHARPNERFVMEVQARRYDSPLDSILTLYNARHEVVAENDDWTDPTAGMVAHQADSRILYTASAEADYVLRIRDVQGKGGDDYVYRLLIAPPRPDFTLRITPDNPRLAQGDTAAITVGAVRRDEFNGEIKLSVEGLPPGFATSDAVIPAGQNEGRLTITAPPDAPAGVLSPTVNGFAIIGQETVMRRAESAEAVMQAFAYTHVLPTEKLWLAVIPQTAFSITSDAGPIEVKPGSETPITVKVHRKDGVRAPVTIMPIRLANNTITSKVAQVPPDTAEATVVLTVSKDAKPTRQDVILSAFMRAGTQTITRYAPAIKVRVVAP